MKLGLVFVGVKLELTSQVMIQLELESYWVIRILIDLGCYNKN